MCELKAAKCMIVEIEKLHSGYPGFKLFNGSNKNKN
jgi:hypothetical protein